MLFRKQYTWGSCCPPDLWLSWQGLGELLRRAGGDLHRLCTAPVYLHQLQLIPSLKSLEVSADLEIFVPSKGVCKISLQHLPRLQELVLRNRVNGERAVSLIHLQWLHNLKRLEVADVLVSKLPLSLTHLSLHLYGSGFPTNQFLAPVQVVLKEHRGLLEEAELGMNLLDNDTASLSHAPCLRDVSKLSLVFDLWTEQHMQWCPGVFTRLQVLGIRLTDLQLVGDACDQPSRPCWDLMTCTSLQTFSLYLDHEEVVSLDGICNVRCPLVVVQTNKEPGYAATFRCTSWVVKKVVISERRPGEAPARRHISQHATVVTEMVGAVMQIPMLSELWLDDTNWSHILHAPTPDSLP